MPAAEASGLSALLIPAVFTFLGTIVGAVLGNWDKIFNRDKLIEAKVSGYASSGNLREEIGVLLERIGMREQIEDLQNRMLKQQEDQFRQQLADAGALEEGLPQLQQMFAIIREEVPDYDDFRKLLVPLWEKYYTLAAIEELNRFQSTNTMRDFRSKSKTINDEYWPMMQALVAKSTARTQARIEQEVGDDDPEAPPRLQ